MGGRLGPAWIPADVARSRSRESCQAYNRTGVRQDRGKINWTGFVAKGERDEFWQPNIGGPLGSAIDLVSREVKKYVTHDPPYGLNTDTAYYNDHGLPHIQGVLQHAREVVTNDYVPTFPIARQAVLCCGIW